MGAEGTGRSLAESLVEARWAYERRTERLTYQAISDLSVASPEAGGIGRYLSLKTARARVRDYLDTLSVVDDETRDEQRAAELEDLARQQRAFTSLLPRVDDAATAQRAFAMNTTPDVLHETRPDLLVLRDERVIVRAVENLRAVGESRRKLLGLDAPTAIHAEVELTNSDAIIDELNAALVAMGEEPVRVSPS